MPGPLPSSDKLPGYLPQDDLSPRINLIRTLFPGRVPEGAAAPEATAAVDIVKPTLG
jgi:hypothetical protein